MTHGDSKIKDMLESLLPSTKRKRARQERQAIHRKVRRKMNRWDGDNETIDPCYDPTYLIHEVKWDRRQADNVSAFIRWATAITKDLPLEKRLTYIKGLLPDNTIGRHALSHLEYLDHFAVPREHDYWYSRPIRTNKEVRAEQKAYAEKKRAELAEKLRELIVSGRVVALNRAIKGAHRPGTYSETYRTQQCKWESTTHYGHRIRGEVTPCECRPRLLLGLHDIDSFITDLSTRLHPEWKNAVESFLKG